MAQQDIGISYQPLSRRIYAGKVNKARTAFLDGKRDVTLEAAAAVVQHVFNEYGSGPEDGMILTDKTDGSQWEITVRKIVRDDTEGAA